ncbi:multicopper oxidase family protein [Amycolatopsis vastitatis]|uniref:Copper oxidase n=1 Tax=Amycolatopsis vastitatis TaxID=1905142 RepID=A0A229T1B1_9PSEU|nr:multicopper oxidase domain-containing protein [Amycolatopsis vastitatis]OXM65076.1 copper oxidase [Amycolatopsis vastitatis]
MTEIIERPAATTPAAEPNWGLTKFLDPLPVPPVLRPHNRETITIPMVATRQKLHSQLPESTLWTYAGHFPGPTIEVRSGRQVRISWSNEIDGKIPLVAVQGPVATAPASRPGRELDRDGYSIIEGVTDLPSWTVVHLHGARTNAGNDGWAHNAGLKGTSQLAEYQNRQQAMPLWYHDHAMAITRFNVHTGLAGMYLIRDDEEDALGLPHGDHEIPLIITDRNLDTDPATGALTGQLLFKVPYVPPNGPLIPFSGPFNLVNGVIWPHLDVDARWYRFRLLNAANSRFYTLNLVDENNVAHNEAVRLIGTDGGLLPAPAELPAGGLTVAPAERFDVLIDFSRFKGQKLKLRNADPALGTIEPDLMEFRVDGRAKRDPFQLPEKVSTSYQRLVHGSTLPDDHDHVWIALLLNADGHPEMWDLQEVDADPGGKGVIELQDPNGGLRTFRMNGRVFDDTTGIFIDHDRWAVWNLVHLAGRPPAHPIHIHLTEFQALFRRSFTTTFDPAAERTTTAIKGFTDVPLEKYEEGWKDTIIVNPGQWVSVAGRFGGGTGEFMFHCHILDHEDEGMMRPFVVHPPEVAKFHVHPGGHHHDG